VISRSGLLKGGMARARGSFGNNWHEAAGVNRVKYRSRHKYSWGGICYGSGIGIGGGCRCCLDLVNGCCICYGPTELENKLRTALSRSSRWQSAAQHGMEKIAWIILLKNVNGLKHGKPCAKGSADPC